MGWFGKCDKWVSENQDFQEKTYKMKFEIIEIAKPKEITLYFYFSSLKNKYFLEQYCFPVPLIHFLKWGISERWIICGSNLSGYPKLKCGKTKALQKTRKKFKIRGNKYSGCYFFSRQFFFVEWTTENKIHLRSSALQVALVIDRSKCVLLRKTLFVETSRNTLLFGKENEEWCIWVYVWKG